MLAEPPASFLFHRSHGFHVEWSWNSHGMINSIWNPTPFPMDSMEQVHRDSVDQIQLKFHGKHHQTCCQK
jgi:hypothetical protein